MLASLSTIAMLAALAAIAVGDVRALKITNRVLLVAYGLAALWYLTHPAAFDMTVPIAGGLFFVLGVGLWMAGGFGGGDAKALPLCGLFAGSTFIPQMLLVMAFASLTLALATVCLRTAHARAALPGAAGRYAMRRKVPFGVPIAAAAAAALLLRAGLG